MKGVDKLSGDWWAQNMRHYFDCFLETASAMGHGALARLKPILGSRLLSQCPVGDGVTCSRNARIYR